MSGAVEINRSLTLAPWPASDADAPAVPPQLGAPDGFEALPHAARSRGPVLGLAKPPDRSIARRLDSGYSKLPVEQPELAQKDAGQPVDWQSIPAGSDLFGHGPSASDVRQGGWHDDTKWGDCYFLAPLAALAQRDPAFVRSMVKDLGDGTYVVRLHDQQGRSHPVRVGGAMPSGKDGAPFYAHYKNDNERWVAIVEKAYASLSGGYEPIGQGADNVGPAFRALTGRVPRITDPSTAKADEVWSSLQAGERSRLPMTAGSREDVPGSVRKAGFDEDHEYTVLGTENDASGRYVVLRNQLDAATYKTDRYDTTARSGSRSDGVFRLRLDDFQAWCSELAILPRR